MVSTTFDAKIEWPLKVVETLRQWGTRFGTARLEQVTILRLSDPQVLLDLRQQPELAQILGDVVGPTTILVPSNHVSTVRKILRELGYIDS